MAEYVCKRCPGVVVMVPGKALENALIFGTPDFLGNTRDSRGQTTFRGGPATLVDCFKCPKCGYSFESLPPTPIDFDKR